VTVILTHDQLWALRLLIEDEIQPHPSKVFRQALVDQGFIEVDEKTGVAAATDRGREILAEWNDAE
jgi:hypothetical protein